MSVNVSKVIVRQANGSEKQLGDYSGTVLLLVNVASKCGFTKQYSGLQELQNHYGELGFQILAFPCNDFGGQEPGTLDEIKEFCEVNYSINFPIFAKVNAMGETTEPFTTINKTQPSGDVAWNFEKFLIGKDGEVLQRFKSAVDPNSLEIKSAIEMALKA